MKALFSDIIIPKIGLLVKQIFNFMDKISSKIELQTLYRQTHKRDYMLFTNLIMFLTKEFGDNWIEITTFMTTIEF